MKGCPFCGEENYLDVFPSRSGYRVCCSKCQIDGPIELSVGKAKRAWNKRAECKLTKTEKRKINGYQPRAMTRVVPSRGGSGVPPLAG